MLSFEAVLEKFGAHRRAGKEYRVHCPVHGDETPSLDISHGDNGAPVFQCRSSGCAPKDILAAVGLTWADVLPDRSRNGHGARTETTWDHTHDYLDARGVLQYQVLRKGSGPEKKITQRRPDRNGGWIYNLRGVIPIPYRLPDLIDVTCVFVVEGELKADCLWSLGLPATCNSGGAKNWHASDTEALKAAGTQEVIILPDNDAPGRAHAVSVAAALESAGIRSRVLVVPGLGPKGDIVDWVRSGHTRAELDALIAPGLDPAFLADAVAVVREGQVIAETGVPYLIDGIIPRYGMLGFLVAYAKVGKTTLGQAMAAAVAMGRPCVERPTTRVKSLIIAAEDPPEYTAYLARVLQIDPGWLTFYRAPLQLTADGLDRIAQTIRSGGYGFVLIASWQAVIRGLVKDENDNAGAVMVVESVKAVTRHTGIPWLIDAHAGKGEDQQDDADPSKAMRGASSAAGAADYTLWLRYANGAFGTQRRFSGKGRFINFAPLTLDLDLPTGAYTLIGSTKDTGTETMWRLISEMGALTSAPKSLTTIARDIGQIGVDGRLSGGARKHIHLALHKRPGVLTSQENHRGRPTTLYRWDPAD